MLAFRWKGSVLSARQRACSFFQYDNISISPEERAGAEENMQKLISEEQDKHKAECASLKREKEKIMLSAPARWCSGRSI